MAQSEVSRAIRKELGGGITQAYLSQVENGHRKHLTETSRGILARFFGIHPGYLVTDPDSLGEQARAAFPTTEDTLDSWLVTGAEKFEGDAEIRDALLTLARHQDSRECVLLMARMLEQPGLFTRVRESLKKGNRDRRKKV